MRVALIHWNEAECAERVERLKAAGYEAVAQWSFDGSATKKWNPSPPAAFVIDLGRLPSHGRMLGAALRQSKTLRRVPLVFVGGAEEKVAVVKGVFPDATFTTWPKVKAALKAAIAAPPARPVVPKALSYASTPLPKKLAIKPGARVVLLDPPAGFEDALGELPDGVKLAGRGAGDLTIWFVRNGEDFESDVERVVRTASPGPLWIAWPKAGSELKSDLNFNVVRDVALAMGLVDYKIASIDATWTASLFKTDAA